MILFWIEYCFHDVMLLSWRELLVLKFLFLVINFVKHCASYLIFVYFTLERTWLCWGKFFSLEFFQFLHSTLILSYCFYYRHISHFMFDVPYPSPQRPRILVQVNQNQWKFPVSFNLIIEIEQMISKIQRVLTIACTKQNVTFKWHFLRELHVSALFTRTSCECSFYLKFMWKVIHVPVRHNSLCLRYNCH